MSKKPTVKIIVATHKKYQMPEDEMYLPLHVGAEGTANENEVDLDFGYTRDDTGDNISRMNPRFSELTGLYWAWKNLDADYIGLVQYRRHFRSGRKGCDPFSNVLAYEELKPYLGQVKVFVPPKRRYYIETLYSHYAHTHYADQLDEARAVIGEKYPEYLSSCDKVLGQRSGHMFNMMIMEKSYFHSYCAWLFDILFTLDEKIDSRDFSAFQMRYLGRISEIIFNVWLDFQLRSGKLRHDELKKLPCIQMENVNWLVKGAAFLSAKFFGVKYKRSF